MCLTWEPRRPLPRSPRPVWNPPSRTPGRYPVSLIGVTLLYSFGRTPTDVTQTPLCYRFSTHHLVEEGWPLVSEEKRGRDGSYTGKPLPKKNMENSTTPTSLSSTLVQRFGSNVPDLTDPLSYGFHTQSTPTLISTSVPHTIFNLKRFESKNESRPGRLCEYLYPNHVSTTYFTRSVNREDPGQRSRHFGPHI